MHGLYGYGRESLGVPSWVLAGSSLLWDSMGKVPAVLWSTQLRLMPPACTGWAFWMGTFVWGHYCFWQAVAILMEKVKEVFFI